MATVEEYHAFFETLWKGAKMDEQEARRALREWVKEHDFTLYDMGLTMYEYHDEDEEGEEEYEPEQWEREKARREELRIYEQHVGLLGDYIMLERNRLNRESMLNSSQFPAQELVRIGQRSQPRDWVTRWRNAWAALPPEEQKKALPGSRMVALVECRIWNEISRWKDPYPPFDYNSGMDVLPVDAEEAAQLGLVRDEEVPRSEEAEDFGEKKELPESEHGADLREIEQWIKEMEAEIAAEDARMRAEGIIKK